MVFYAEKMLNFAVFYEILWFPIREKRWNFLFSHGILWFSIVKNVEFCCVPCNSMISHSEKMLYFLCLMESYGFLEILCFTTMCKYRKKAQLIISGNENR